MHKKAYFSHFVHKFVYIPGSERFSFAKIFHSPDRCGISRNWLWNSMIITQLHIVLGRIKSHSKMCSCVTQRNWCLKLRERAIGMLAAGMSTRVVARELNVHFSTISHLHCFREFSMSRVWRCVGVRFADNNVVNSVPYRWQFECTKILWRDPEAH